MNPVTLSDATTSLRGKAGHVSEVEPDRENTPWLQRFDHLLPPERHVLDLGCGVGDDTVELAAMGCAVIALDFDQSRIRQVPHWAAQLCIVGDIATGLPFADRSFDSVISSLSLHYFTHAETERAFADIARILIPSGNLICRVNATGDLNFGYGAGEEVEPSVFRQSNGYLKRFFDKPMLLRFIDPCFRLIEIAPRSILQNGVEKRTLECLARKR